MITHTHRVPSIQVYLHVAWLIPSRTASITEATLCTTSVALQKSPNDTTYEDFYDTTDIISNGRLLLEGYAVFLQVMVEYWVYHTVQQLL